MNPRRLLRKLSRRLAVRRLLPSGPPPAWWQEVIRCQDIIAASEPNPYYLQAYRREEIWCWIHIAKWLWEDGRERRPRRCLDIGCAYGTLSLYCRRLFSCQVCCTDCTDRYLSSALVQQQGLTFAQSNIELDTPLWALTSMSSCSPKSWSTSTSTPFPLCGKSRGCWPREVGSTSALPMRPSGAG